MRFLICDIPIIWEGGHCPVELQPFACDGAARAADDDAALRIHVRAVPMLPAFPTPEYEVSLTCVAPATDGALVAWNSYDDAEFTSARLELASDRTEILITPRTLSCSVLNMVMLALLPAVAERSGVLLHASLVSYGPGSVAFTASSGTGKSTQAELWREHLGAQIMNGDRAFIRRASSPEAGSQTDRWLSFGSPWAGSSPYVHAVEAPLSAVVVLEQAPENRIRRLEPLETMAYLYHNVRYPFWGAGATAATLETLDELVRTVPVYVLACRPDVEAVQITRDAVFGAA